MNELTRAIFHGSLDAVLSPKRHWKSNKSINTPHEIGSLNTTVWTVLLCVWLWTDWQSWLKIMDLRCLTMCTAFCQNNTSFIMTWTANLISSTLTHYYNHNVILLELAWIWRSISGSRYISINLILMPIWYMGSKEILSWEPLRNHDWREWGTLLSKGKTGTISLICSGKSDEVVWMILGLALHRSGYSLQDSRLKKF